MTEPLTCREMIERLSAGENPLELSIEKYKRLLAILESGDEIEEYWIMADCCPLCEKYLCGDDNYNDDYPQCPLEMHNMACENTLSPWGLVYTSLLRTSEEQKIAIKNMIEKLKWVQQRMIEDD